MNDLVPRMDLCKRIAARLDCPSVFVTISGAHLYGFPSPDSDYDIRGSHVLPTRDLLTLDEPRETLTYESVEEGVEIDHVSHDIRKFCSMLLKRNGYVLEQLTSPLIVQTTEFHRELLSLVPRMVTRHHVHHYLGFVQTQRGLFAKEDPPRIKPLLYIYRVLLTGIHLMRTGETQANLVILHDLYSCELGLSYIPHLIARKVESREQAVISADDRAFHDREHDRLEAVLKREGDLTRLPEAPSCRGEINDLLVRVRSGDGPLTPPPPP